ncbi:hypothetical protein AGMMS50249_3820 [candidate division SR1 bacterium]|nr:hypothetical protein AGMMS50249_3820 [candidate division SR1 bacterium]
MLNLVDIQPFFPPRLHSFPRAILREYLQYKILATIFSHRLAQKLCFIGGTALRIGYNSQRFSEDLDFDNWGLTTDEFETLTNLVQQELKQEGYGVEIRHIYKGAFHCVIKIPDVLFENHLASMKTEKLVIKVDTVPQGTDYQPISAVLQRVGIISPYKLAPKEALLSMKLSALFQRVKGRDLFDIVYLLSFGTKPDFKVLSHLSDISTPAELENRLKSRITELDFPTLGRDVAPFLFDPNNQSVALFPQIIQQTKWD